MLLEPYHKSITKRVVKAPRLYFLDTGSPALVSIADKSSLLATQLAGAFCPPLWLWRTSHGDEVDLLIERGARFVAIECKLTEQPNAGDANKLLRFRESTARAPWHAL